MEKALKIVFTLALVASMCALLVSAAPKKDKQKAAEQSPPPYPKRGPTGYKESLADIPNGVWDQVCVSKTTSNKCEKCCKDNLYKNFDFQVHTDKETGKWYTKCLCWDISSQDPSKFGVGEVSTGTSEQHTY